MFIYLNLKISRIRQDILKEKEDVIELSNKKINFLRNQLDTQRLVQVHMVEEQKHSQIQRLELNHEQAFVNMKAYYSDITLGNLNVIKTLNVNNLLIFKHNILKVNVFNYLIIIK